MTKSSPQRLAKKGFVADNRRNFNAEEIMELTEMIRLVNMRKFEAAQIKGNTALVPDGQKLAEQVAAVATLLENAKNIWVSQHLLLAGYPEGTKCDVNLQNGAILVHA